MNTINIKALSEQVARLDGKVGSIPVGKIPKDYSTTEMDTGIKWIDGNEIYTKAYHGTIPNITENTTIELDVNFNNIIYALGSVRENTNLTYMIPFYSTSTLVSYIINSAVNGLGIRLSPNFKNGIYDLVVYYTKPTAPSKSPDDEPETKATKAAKKKASK